MRNLFPLAVLAVLALSSPVFADEPKPAAVLFCTADWCPACQTMKPVVERVQAHHPIRVINWDKESDTCRRFGVRLLPTFLRIHKGKETDRAVGVISEERLRAMCRGKKP